MRSILWLGQILDTCITGVETLDTMISVFQTLGFPVACVVALMWFVYKYINRIMDENKHREENYQMMITEYGKNLATITSTLERMETKMEKFEDDLTVIKNRD